MSTEGDDDATPARVTQLAGCTVCIASLCWTDEHHVSSWGVPGVACLVTVDGKHGGKA
jgi:hypothetical protein